MLYRWAWVLVSVLLSLSYGYAEEVTRPTGDRLAFNPSSANLVFGCPSMDALYDVIDNGVYTTPGENVCSLFGGENVVGEGALYGFAVIPLGAWYEYGGTEYVTNLYVLRIGDTKIYGAWPFDIDGHLMMQTIDATGTIIPPVIGSGFLGTVAYEVWPERKVTPGAPAADIELHPVMVVLR